MTRQQKITIKIADVAPNSMTVPDDAEEVVRTAEYNVNRLWIAWRNRFSDKTSKEVLAMVAYQFAKLYYETLRQGEEQQSLLENFEAELDRLLEIE